MARRPSPDAPPCPHCQGRHTIKNGHKGGRQRWLCQHCRQTFGLTHGTPLYQLHTSPVEVARSLLISMRRGSCNAAEEITAHKAETLRRWLRRAAAHAEALTAVLVHDLHLSLVEVDAFWSFVKKSAPTRRTPPTKPVAWANDGGS